MEYCQMPRVQGIGKPWRRTCNMATLDLLAISATPWKKREQRGTQTRGNHTLD